MSKDKVIADDMKKITSGKIKLFRGKGCEKCGKSGYRHRIGIFEVLEMSPKIAELTLDRKPADLIEKVAVEEGMLTLLQDGYLKVIEGITTLEEVMRVAKG